jgi:hypothetical protein
MCEIKEAAFINLLTSVAEIVFEQFIFAGEIRGLGNWLTGCRPA